MATIMNSIVKDYIFGWRISVSVPFVAGTILASGMLLLPRSPRLGYLVYDFAISVSIIIGG